MIIREVEKKDFGDINRLYNDVYEGFYPLPETYNRRTFEETTNDTSHLWLVAEEDKKIIASLLLVGNRDRDLCKFYGAAVAKEFQKKGILYEIHREAERRVEYGIYYAIARMNYLAPQKLLEKLGFMPLGIFPNAMRVKEVETHGLFVTYRNAPRERKRPVIIKPFEGLYSCASRLLDLGEADVVPEGPASSVERSVDLKIGMSPSVSGEWNSYMEDGALELSYFPFFVPNLKLYSDNLSTEVFIYHNPMAAHIYVLGIKTSDPMVEVLNGIASAALSMGCYYIESVLPAESPELQSAMYDAGYLPSAYFPAFKKDTDCFVACKLLLPPSFRWVHADEMNKSFLSAYSELYIERMRRDLYGWSDR